jgi:hypothetical protein
MGRGVVLHLLSRLERIATRRWRGGLADLVFATKRRECRVRQLSARLREFFMDADQMTLISGVQLQQLIPVGLGPMSAR